MASKLKPLLAALGHLVHLDTMDVAEYRDARWLRVGPQSIKHELGLLGRVLKTAQQNWA